MIEFDDDTQVGSRPDETSAPKTRDRAYLIVLAGANVGEMFKIAKEAVVIGRALGNDVQAVSYTHLTLPTILRV